MKVPYKIYWLTKGPHCNKARKVKQTDRKIAYVCKHNLGEDNAKLK